MILHLNKDVKIFQYKKNVKIFFLNNIVDRIMDKLIFKKNVKI